MNRRILLSLAGIMAIGLFITGCGQGARKNIIKISGSTSVGPVIEAQAQVFKREMPEITVEVNQLGSSAGIKDAINGTAEIGLSSRDLKEREIEAGIKDMPVAYDGMSIVLNNENIVKNLTMEQVRDIYTGKIKNWKEVGGEDTPIVVVSREDGSGTRDAFQEIVGYDSTQLTKEAQISDGNGNIKSTVAGNENAIGYTSFSYLDESINSTQIDGVDPTAENAKSGKYKLARPFLLVYKEDSISENGKQFIDYVLSEDGQKIVEEKGLIRVK